MSEDENRIDRLISLLQRVRDRQNYLLYERMPGTATELNEWCVSVAATEATRLVLERSLDVAVDIQRQRERIARMRP